MSFDHERAEKLRKVSEEYLKYKPLLIEEDQPRVTNEIDSRLDELRREMHVGKDPRYVEEGVALINYLKKIAPVIGEYPRLGVITNGVVSAFEHLHPEEIPLLANPTVVITLISEVNNQLNQEHMPGLPGLLEVHGFLHAINYIIDSNKGQKE